MSSELSGAARESSGSYGFNQGWRMVARRFLGVNRMIDVPIILSAVYPKMRSALGFDKAEKANRSLDIDVGRFKTASCRIKCVPKTSPLQP